MTSMIIWYIINLWFGITVVIIMIIPNVEFEFQLQYNRLRFAKKSSWLDLIWKKNVISNDMISMNYDMSWISYNLMFYQ